MVLVHQGTPEQGADFYRRFPGVKGYRLVADPQREAFARFGLGMAGAGQILNPMVMLEGMRVTLSGHGVSKFVGEPKQMPGVFLVRDGEIVAEHRYRTISDRVNFRRLLRVLD